MRLYLAAPIIPRRIEGRAELGRYALQGPACVITSVYNIHRHPEFWPGPLRFDPERFGPAHSAERHHLAYMPFGAGSRMCIGNNLAMTEGVLPAGSGGPEVQPGAAGHGPDGTQDRRHPATGGRHSDAARAPQVAVQVAAASCGRFTRQLCTRPTCTATKRSSARHSSARPCTLSGSSISPRTLTRVKPRR